MLRFATLAVLAAAVVVGLYSASVLLALAVICGAGGVATLIAAPAEAPVVMKRRAVSGQQTANR